MPLQDLTPQLRTRLNRAEQFVGWFVGLALAGLLAVFAYYIFYTAKQKGWFLTSEEPTFLFGSVKNVICEYSQQTSECQSHEPAYKLLGTIEPGTKLRCEVL